MASRMLRQVFKLPLRELVVAPMVDQSELAYRMLCRKYGATLCYTPMLHSRIFSENPTYRELKFTTCPEDRPLIVQFCGHDKDTLLRAARLVENDCDAVDLNLGCPQGIARKGRYGSFLLEEFDLLAGIVKHLTENLSVPVTCKIRILTPGDEEAIERTIKLGKLLQGAGCKLLTVHGRTKEQKGSLVGQCNWAAIKRIKDALDIPVIANGGIGTFADAATCQQATGCDAVMSSEAILENPTMVAGMADPPCPFQVSLDYLDMVEKFGEGSKIVRAHLFKFLYAPMLVHLEARDEITKVKPLPHGRPDVDTLRKLIVKLKGMHDSGECQLACCRAQPAGQYYPWYDRHRKQNKALYMSDGPEGLPDRLRGTTRGAQDDIVAKREKRRLARAEYKRLAAKRKIEKRERNEQLAERNKQRKLDSQENYEKRTAQKCQS